MVTILIRPQVSQVKFDNNTEFPENGDILNEGEETDFREFKITKKRAWPPGIPNLNDKFSTVAWLNLSLERDIAWILLSAVGNIFLEKNFPGIRIEELKAIGSWTVFSKGTSHAEAVKC